MEINTSTQQKVETLKEFFNRHMTAIDIIAGVLITVLVMATVFVYTQYREVARELVAVQDKGAAVETNRKVLDFAKMFIDDVLKADGEIDFDTRLKLESAVRSLEDKTIFDAWQRFTGSSTERQAQDAVKDLLSVLVAKIQY
jgi:predicted negative regulator of RcsB-dependent stress response